MEMLFETFYEDWIIVCIQGVTKIFDHIEIFRRNFFLEKFNAFIQQYA